MREMLRDAGTSVSKYILGMMYRKGVGGPVNDVIARQLFNESNFSAAKKELERM